MSWVSGTIWIVCKSVNNRTLQSFHMWTEYRFYYSLSRCEQNTGSITVFPDVDRIPVLLQSFQMWTEYRFYYSLSRCEQNTSSITVFPDVDRIPKITANVYTEVIFCMTYFSITISMSYLNYISLILQY